MHEIKDMEKMAKQVRSPVRPGANEAIDFYELPLGPFGIGSDRIDADVENRKRAIHQIIMERHREEEIHGPDSTVRHVASNPFKSVAILAEEVGELSQAFLNEDLRHARTEAVKVAAVALAIVEGLEAHLHG